MKWACLIAGAVLGFALVTAGLHERPADVRAGDPPCMACW